jgi:hypothetical protein
MASEKSAIKWAVDNQRVRLSGEIRYYQQRYNTPEYPHGNVIIDHKYSEVVDQEHHPVEIVYPTVDNKGYSNECYIKAKIPSQSGGLVRVRLHVLLAYLKEPRDDTLASKMEIDHLNSDPYDNRVPNLQPTIGTEHHTKDHGLNHSFVIYRYDDSSDRRELVGKVTEWKYAKVILEAFSRDNLEIWHARSRSNRSNIKIKIDLSQYKVGKTI